MRTTRSVSAALLLLLPLVASAALAQEGREGDIFVQPEPLWTAETVVIEMDIRMGDQNMGQERRLKNEIKRLLREWGRYEVVDKREDADLTITLVTNDQINFFKGIYEPLKSYANVHKMLFVVSSNGEEESLVWADGTTDSFTGRRVSGNQRRGWDNEGTKRIAALFVNTLRERVDAGI